ncbi:DUF4253 domain-containing protein [Aggregatimonas sangjinii]|uniref:DUF4253 domain-containing protein n=1 Tax=Aggregatimonas sangjinii TaxID=2583587 RepID=A0A5B7SNR1_9FLAO|nr:DUF4253 domain-containing protein [Aggregatimonas sangjinii]QCW99058.1 DUF4253 domain-containing protein [Aggregatimonas sangjinii]
MIKNNILLITFALLGLIGAQAQELTKKEVLLADSLEFDKDILKLVRSQTTATFRGIPKNDRYEYPAVVLTIERNKASKLIDELMRIKHRLKTKGYIIFTSMRSDDGETDEVRIVKTDDPLYPIKYMDTQGSFPKLSNEQIFDKIERWYGRKGCVVIGAGPDWIAVKFVLPLENTDEFANDMINFCPALESVYRGAERLAAKLKEDNPKILLEW